MRALLVSIFAWSLLLIPSHAMATGTYQRGGGVVTVASGSLPVTGSPSLIYRVTGQTDANDCDNTPSGSAVAYCGWNGSSYGPIGSGGATGLTNPLGVALDLGTNDIVNVGDVDGRDVSADGTKLDGIESGATADQTDAEILAAWEAETGRTVADDALKLDAIQALATRSTSFDSFVDISDRTTACQNWATAVEDFMDGTYFASNGADATFRMLVTGQPTNPIRVAVDTYDESGAWPYDACFMLHPQGADSTTGVWPDSTTGGGQSNINITGPTTRATMDITMATGTIPVDESAMDKNACLFEFGNGYLAGRTGNDPFGRLGGTVRISGKTRVYVSTHDFGGYSANGMPGEGIPENSSSARLNQWSTTTFSPFCFFGATYLDAADWEIDWSIDRDDIGLWMAESWGSSGPTVNAPLTLNGVGMQFYGIINNDVLSLRNLRGGDYGIVLGGGEPTDHDIHYWASCASGSCADVSRPVEGLKIAGGVVEGQDINLLTINDAKNFIKVGEGTHWECAAGRCRAGAISIRPKLCDGTTGTTPGAPGRPAWSTNEASDCSCEDRFNAGSPYQVTGNSDGLCDEDGSTSRATTGHAAAAPPAPGDWVGIVLGGNPLPTTDDPNIPNIWLGPAATDEFSIVIPETAMAGTMDELSTADEDKRAPFKASAALTCGAGDGCAQVTWSSADTTNQQDNPNAPIGVPHSDYAGFVRFHPKSVLLSNSRLQLPGAVDCSVRVLDNEVCVEGDGGLFVEGTEIVGGGGGTPGGSDTHVQYNASGAFAGEAAFAYNAGTDTLTVGQLLGTTAITSVAVNAGVFATTTGAVSIFNAGGGAVVLNAPTTGVTSYTLPSDDGDAGEQLQTNGSGVLSWEPAGAGGGYATVDNEDAPLTQRTTLNFEGAGVTCADDVDQTTCTIPGGGAASLTDLSDVTLTTPATGAVLIKSAGDWVDGQLDLADADAVTGILPDGNIPSGIARDSEVAAGYQPLDADLTAVAAVATQAYGRSLLALADAAAARTAVGLDSDDDVTFGSVTIGDPGSGDRVWETPANDNAENLGTPPADTCRFGFIASAAPDTTDAAPYYHCEGGSLTPFGAGGGTVDDITGDSGTTTGANVTIAGGTNGVDTVVSGDTLTVNVDTTEFPFHATGPGLTGAGGVLSMIRTCLDNQVLKYTGAGGWACAADSTGGSPTFDAIATGANTTAAMTLDSGSSLIFNTTAGGSAAMTGAGTLAGDPTMAANGIAVGATGLLFEGASADAFETIITATDPTADRTVTIPNASTTLPVFGQLATFINMTAPRIYTLPDADATLARTDAAQTFTGTQTFGSGTSILLGAAGSTVGSVGFRNQTSGTITVQPVAGALGTVTQQLPPAAGINQVNNFGSTASSAGTLTLNASSQSVQRITGTTTHTVQMPAVTASGMALGRQWTIANDSTGLVTVNSSGGNAIAVLATGRRATFIQNATTGTDATVWTVVGTRWSGTTTLNPGAAVTAGSCATAITATATGLATTDVITWTPSTDITTVNGYNPASNPGIQIVPYPTANTVNFKLCNPTGADITPGSIAVNWAVVQ